MSQAPHPPGRSPPAGIPARHTSPRPVILPPGPLRVQVVRPRRCAAAGAPPGPAAGPDDNRRLPRGDCAIPSPTAPVFIESGPLNDTLLRSHRHTGRVVRCQEVAVRGLADAWGASAVRAPR